MKPAPVLPTAGRARLISKAALEATCQIGDPTDLHFSSLTEPSGCVPRVVGRVPMHTQERLCRLLRSHEWPPQRRFAFRDHGTGGALGINSGPKGAFLDIAGNKASLARKINSLLSPYVPRLFRYSSIFVNLDTIAHEHVDSGNHGLSVLILLGQFQGGAYFSEGHSDINEVGTVFLVSGLIPHGSRPFQRTGPDGRISIVLYVHLALETFDEASRHILTNLGFRIESPLTADYPITTAAFYDTVPSDSLDAAHQILWGHAPGEVAPEIVRLGCRYRALRDGAGLTSPGRYRPCRRPASPLGAVGEAMCDWVYATKLDQKLQALLEPLFVSDNLEDHGHVEGCPVLGNVAAEARQRLALLVKCPLDDAESRPPKQTFHYKLLHHLAVFGKDLDAEFALDCIHRLPLGIEEDLCLPAVLLRPKLPSEEFHADEDSWPTSQSNYS